MHFVIGIEDPHALIELEAIDDDRALLQTDMFRPQIPVAFDNGASGNARLYPRRGRSQQCVDTIQNGHRVWRRHAQVLPQEDLSVDQAFALQVGQINVAICNSWRALFSSVP